jgi:hypothetical protein
VIVRVQQRQALFHFSPLLGISNHFYALMLGLSSQVCAFQQLSSLVRGWGTANRD